MTIARLQTGLIEIPLLKTPLSIWRLDIFNEAAARAGSVCKDRAGSQQPSAAIVRSDGDPGHRPNDPFGRDPIDFPRRTEGRRAHGWRSC
jgi:hypothetical protein